MDITQWVSFITAVGIASWVGFAPVTAFSCSFGREPNPKENGIIRWVMPLNHRLRCQCTSIYPGGLNTYTPDRGFDPFYTEHPLFTDLKTEISNYFECKNCSVTCENGGTFIDDPCHCSCDKNWIGNNCTECALTDCENGGTFNEKNCTCTCPTEWMGNTCAECVLTDCENGGTFYEQTCTCTCPTEWMGKTCAEPRRYDCKDYYDAGERRHGVHTIYPLKYPEGLEVFCDMKYWPGWIVIQKRSDKNLNFSRGWDEYRDGFGDIAGDNFWLGNEKVRQLTEDDNTPWRIGVQAWGSQGDRCSVFTNFRLSGENYTIHVDGPSNCWNNEQQQVGTFLSANNMPFSTRDRDNDGDSGRNCAEESKGGWWFNGCSEGGTSEEINLNAEDMADGAFTFSRMRIKRV